MFSPTYLKLSVFVLAFLIVGKVWASDTNAGIVCPNERQKEWADAEIGVIIHFDMPVYKPDYNHREYGTHPSPTIFNPSNLNTDQWLEAAKNLGARYAVLVAKHGSGFSLWPTKMHDYSIKNSPWKNGQGDIVADFIESCNKYGIKPGIYASTTANGYLKVDNPGRVLEGSPVTQEEYNRIVVGQLTELWTNYGELFEIWFDGGVLSTAEGGADVLSLLNELQPNAIAFQGPYGYSNLVRWVGNEEGVAPSPCWATADSTTTASGAVNITGLHGRADAPFWCPGESDFTLRYNNAFQAGWFWKEGEDEKMFNVEQLMQKYETSVGHNTNMLLGIVIDNTGRVPDADFNRLKEFGGEIECRYGNPIKEIAGNGNRLELTLDSPKMVDRIVIQEDITFGERVLEYKIMGLSTTGEWLCLATGQSIGHKHISKFEPVYLKELRLYITNYKDTPKIKQFAIYEKL